MLKKATLLLILTDFCLSSCQNYLTRKYELGKPFSFENKKQFAEFIEKRTSISAENIYYADSIGYVNLIKSLQQKNREGILWGFYGDGILIKNSEHEKSEKLYCKKRIQDIVFTFIDQSVFPEVLMADTASLLKFQLRNLKEHIPIVLLGNQKKNVVILQYATGFGTYYKDLFIDVQKIIQSHTANTQAVLICLDPVFKLK